LHLSFSSGLPAQTECVIQRNRTRHLEMRPLEFHVCLLRVLAQEQTLRRTRLYRIRLTQSLPIMAHEGTPTAM
jgi:hypothetical protein